MKNPGVLKTGMTCDLVDLEAKGGWESNLDKSCGMLALLCPHLLLFGGRLSCEMVSGVTQQGHYCTSMSIAQKTPPGSQFSSKTTQLQKVM